MSVHVIGVGMTAFGKQPDRSVKSLVAEAVSEALADAQLGAGEVHAAFFANTVQGALEGQLMVRGQIALRPLGIQGIPVFNVENACASASAAFELGVAHIRAGLADVVLVVGCDKMVVPDRRAMFGVFDGAWDVHEVEANRQRLLGEQADASPERSVFMDIYAAFARTHMQAFGTTQRQIATVAAKNHVHGALNPRAQYRKAMTVDEVLAGSPVVWPLTVPMCAPVSDGAAAAVICSEERARRLGLRRAVRVLSTVTLTGVPREASQFDLHLAAIGARRAYEAAGVGPEDMSLAEVHDATAFAEIQQVENLGLCALGQGGAFVESGAASLGGRTPVNPSGGLECRGHPIGATGLAQIHELVTQLRGEAGARQVANARLAIAENGGGLYQIEEATAALTVLGRN